MAGCSQRTKRVSQAEASKPCAVRNDCWLTLDCRAPAPGCRDGSHNTSISPRTLSFFLLLHLPQPPVCCFHLFSLSPIALASRARASSICLKQSLALVAVHLLCKRTLNTPRTNSCLLCSTPAKQTRHHALPLGWSVSCRASFARRSGSGSALLPSHPPSLWYDHPPSCWRPHR